MRIKGNENRADEKIENPEIGRLVGLLDTLLARFDEMRPTFDV